MQYENKILNFHIYLYFPSNIFKKFKNIKIKGLTYYILTCIISLVFTRNKSKHTIQYARVAQWWSTSLPRRGSRVRSPSRAYLNPYPSDNSGGFFLICLTTVSDISYYINSHTSSHLAYNYIHLHSFQTETIYNNSLW